MVNSIDKPMLKVDNIVKRFGGLAAIDDLSFEVQTNEILGLIGPNGAGKSTVFNVVSAFLPLTSGRIEFRGQDISHEKSHTIAGLGIARAFQAATLFEELSVLDNVFTGFHMSYTTPIHKRFFRTAAALREEAEFREKARELIHFMGLSELENEIASNISYGNQKILGICMALATNPTLLLLDEPVTGMNPQETHTMMELIRQIRKSGITVVVVEHDMKMVKDVCDRVIAINFGQKLCEGSPEEVLKDERVIECYLGTSEGSSKYATS